MAICATSSKSVRADEGLARKDSPTIKKVRISAFLVVVVSAWFWIDHFLFILGFDSDSFQLGSMGVRVFRLPMWVWLRNATAGDAQVFVCLAIYHGSKFDLFFEPPM